MREQHFSGAADGNIPSANGRQILVGLSAMNWV
jgi:hypothetical protein